MRFKNFSRFDTELGGRIFPGVSMPATAGALCWRDLGDMWHDIYDSSDGSDESDGEEENVQIPSDKFITSPKPPQPIECPICFESIHQYARLKCSHAFCAPCISKWAANRASCPVCRVPIRFSDYQ
jgi:hypothetical protein